MQSASEHEPRQLLLRLAPFLRPYWLRALEAGVCMGLTTLLALPMPLVSIYIIDSVVANGDAGVLHLLCCALLVVVTVSLIMAFLQRSLLIVFTRRVFFDLEMSLLRKVHTLPIPFFNRYGSAYIATRISDDVRQLSSLMAGSYIEGLGGLVLLVVAIGIMLTIHPLLTLLSLVILPGFIWVNLRFGGKIQTLANTQQEKRGLTNSTRLESLKRAQIVRSFGREGSERMRVARDLHTELDVGLQLDVVMVGAPMIQMFLYSLGGLLLLWYGASQIIEGRLTLGEYVAFNTLLAYVYGPMSQLTVLYVNFKRGLGVLRRIVEIQDTPSEARTGNGIEMTSVNRIAFEGVQFGMT